MSRIGLTIEPLDTLFFRDGRPFDGQPRAMSGLPLPQTLAGALRTWLLRENGCKFPELTTAVKAGKSFDAALDQQGLASIASLGFRGPWLCREDGPLVPVPAIIRRVKDSDETVCLAPLPRGRLPGWQHADMLPLWCQRREPTERVEGFLTRGGLRRFLDEEKLAWDDIVNASALYGSDRRTGIVVGSATRTAEEGQIYGVSLLALKPGVSFYAEIAGEEAALAKVPGDEDVIPFGGEGRRVRVTRAVPPFDWPSAPTKNGCTMLVLTAPAPFGGWRPDGLNVVAAAVPGHVEVSGWDLARGCPKPNRFAVAAGSVYFLDEPMGDRPVAGSLCAGEDARLGWGTYVMGGWNYA